MRTPRILALAATATLAAGVATAALAPSTSADESAYWACVALTNVDVGVCIDQPLEYDDGTDDAEKPAKSYVPRVADYLD